MVLTSNAQFQLICAPENPNVVRPNLSAVWLNHWLELPILADITSSVIQLVVAG
jgi:hypothetical protein